jgi:putative IMPACT (imprinted ancient) family translation regulator
VVVTRWYGGIKLGAGGLARAYGGTAAECLRLAPRVAIVAMTRLGVHCEFADLALMKARLKDIGVEIEQEHFDANGVTLQMRLPLERASDVKARIIDISRGRSEAYALNN